MSFDFRICGRTALVVLAAVVAFDRGVLADQPVAPELVKTSNGSMSVGVDPAMGGSIVWLSSRESPANHVNHADPGRLIQQSYYAGRTLDRQADGQSKSWSPWPWNPIQGGGVGSWAAAKVETSADGKMITSESVPKLWDMPDEPAEATMWQTTAFHAELRNVVEVNCKFTSARNNADRWGPAVARHQELPACYFTRRYDQFVSYLGEGKWQEVTQPAGPPWGTATPPRKAMACLDADGRGIAIYSPASGEHWNFGPHGGGNSADPTAGPCVHVAPTATVTLGRRSVLEYRYWLVMGTREEISASLDALAREHHEETIRVSVSEGE